MSNQPCEACNGKGWRIIDTGDDQLSRYEIQRCDQCEQFDSDIAAFNAVEKAALSQPALLKFVENVAALKHENEPDGVEPFERASEDAIAQLNQLILDARKLMGTAGKCVECGEIVPYLIGCPDGRELCQACFDAAD
jgi:hypothetical protein